MLSDNIRNYRKKNNLSQDELAEKIGVSRQSVSFWENGQTQPTIENIIALTKIFGISSDVLLDNAETSDVSDTSEISLEDVAVEKQKKNPKKGLIIAITAISAVIICCVVAVVIGINRGESENSVKNTESSSVTLTETAPETVASSNDTLDVVATVTPDTTESESTTESTSEAEPEPDTTEAPVVLNTEEVPPPVESSDTVKATETPETTQEPVVEPFDLFSYCKNFAIEKGQLNGDYCIYQQPSTKYGGYSNEYFSISYWSGSDMVEFCLHCPLSETQSHNFYIRMRGGFNHQYEYLSSKYFRDTGESIRSASGYIDPSIFSDNYPIGYASYEGSVDGQTEFMEETRIGICDLIRCLKQFVDVEGMECEFSAFEFKNF